MKQYSTYKISGSDRFNAFDFPKVEEEITGLVRASRDSSLVNKPDMIVSFLKDHSLQQAWIATNSPLAALITGGSLSITHIEGLFESSRACPVFQQTFEDHIKSRLAGDGEDAIF